MTPERKVDAVLEAIDAIEEGLKRFRDALMEFRSVASESMNTLVFNKHSDAFFLQFKRVFVEEKGNKVKIAARYGVSRKTIYRWMAMMKRREQI